MPSHAHTSRITVVTSGTPAVIEQIKAQLGRLVPVHRVVDITTEKPGIEREMALIDDAPRSASARAKGEVRVFPIDEARFQGLDRKSVV